MSKETTTAFVQVFQGMNPTEPYLLKDWLRSNGVGAEVRGFDFNVSSRRRAPATFGGYPSVWVPPHAVQQASTQPILSSGFRGDAMDLPCL